MKVAIFLNHFLKPSNVKSFLLYFFCISWLYESLYTTYYPLRTKASFIFEQYSYPSYPCYIKAGLAISHISHSRQQKSLQHINDPISKEICFKEYRVGKCSGLPTFCNSLVAFQTAYSSSFSCSGPGIWKLIHTIWSETNIKDCSREHFCTLILTKEGCLLMIYSSNGEFQAGSGPYFVTPEKNLVRVFRSLALHGFSSYAHAFQLYTGVWIPAFTWDLHNAPCSSFLSSWYLCSLSFQALSCLLL